MAEKFKDLALIPHINIIRAGGVSDTYGNRRLQECIDVGIVKRPCRTITGRTLLTAPDGLSFYEALITVRGMECQTRTPPCWN